MFEDRELLMISCQHSVHKTHLLNQLLVSPVLQDVCAVIASSFDFSAKPWFCCSYLVSDLIPPRRDRLTVFSLKDVSHSYKHSCLAL